MNEKIDVDNLETGMFVTELDRPWLDTPFLFQGFLIETVEQIAQLRQYCRYVLVDPLRSLNWDSWHVTPERKEALRRLEILDRQNLQALVPLPLGLAEQASGAFGRNVNRYPDRAQLEQELPRAK